MKFLLVLCVVVFSANAKAENLGLGVIVGVPSGISARYWTSADQSIEANAGWSLANTNKFHLNAAYLFNKKDVFELKDETFDFFFGGGLSLRTKSGTNEGEVVFGPRLPVGVNYFFADPKLEIFSEAALNIGMIPSSDIYMDIGAGIRFYFE